jgi:uncharacterized protein (TIGR03067 family)
MRSRLFVIVVSALIVPACGKDNENTKEVEKNKEVERFQGTWRWESVDNDGIKVPVEDFRDWRIVKEGSKYTLTQGNFVVKGTFEVDASKNPKTIDITRTEGPKKGTNSKGIYELDGDTYKICMDPEGKNRPTLFESKKGSGYGLQVLKRVKE